jgi:hypothetical protein
MLMPAMVIILIVLMRTGWRLTRAEGLALIAIGLLSWSREPPVLRATHPARGGRRALHPQRRKLPQGWLKRKSSHVSICFR